MLVSHDRCAAARCRHGGRRTVWTLETGRPDRPTIPPESPGHSHPEIPNRSRDAFPSRTPRTATGRRRSPKRPRWPAGTRTPGRRITRGRAEALIAGGHPARGEAQSQDPPQGKRTARVDPATSRRMTGYDLPRSASLPTPVAAGCPGGLSRPAPSGHQVPGPAHPHLRVPASRCRPHARGRRTRGRVDAPMPSERRPARAGRHGSP